ncbi:2'-5' RNA ligase [Barrientosiimonas humi]|uniref:2'-5' RNA ligase n=1 Tax=Barrientosiimonas humi TaxID=999931 RepID=A0A542XDZ5_9MICO|nr:2'-5' RNA ligase family protein [Barrientosiimonas humi]TQL34053.1 2'-5' RNA ligase [Barrientosiimonas humi]CAG7574044.1 Putative phosphoesterase YjcG [Barrientosiimonas humi]
MTTTIGVSIPVPAPYGEQLQDARRRSGDPLADAVPTHVTLMPPTDLAQVEQPEFTQHLRAVAAAAAPFRMTLQGTGTFRPVSPVVFVAVAEGIGMCERLEQAVRSGPVRRELEFPYHPHVTVAQAVDDDALDRTFEELAGYRCQFEVSAFDLYLHGEDRVWRPIDRFELGLNDTTAS